MFIATELGRVEVYNEELPFKSQGSSITWSCKVRKNYICYISATTHSMATKPGKKVTYCDLLPTIKSHYPLNTWLLEVTIKHSRVVTYNEQFPSIKSEDPSFMWSRKVTWQSKYIIFLLLQGLWPLNMASWWLTV